MESKPEGEERECAYCGAWRANLKGNRERERESAYYGAWRANLKGKRQRERAYYGAWRANLKGKREGERGCILWSMESKPEGEERERVHIMEHEEQT